MNKNLLRFTAAASVFFASCSQKQDAKHIENIGTYKQILSHFNQTDTSGISQHDLDSLNNLLDQATIETNDQTDGSLIILDNPGTFSSPEQVSLITDGFIKDKKGQIIGSICHEEFQENKLFTSWSTTSITFAGKNALTFIENEVNGAKTFTASKNTP